MDACSVNVTGPLYQTVHAGFFFTINDDEILREIHNDFPQELDRLKRAYSIREPGATLPLTLSPSQVLYGTEYDEINRTLVGILALRWLHNGQYELFVGTQPGPARLTRDSFAWTRKVFVEGIRNPADLYALITSTVINDLGKDPQLTSDYLDWTGEDVSGLNHDMILLKAVTSGLIQSLDRLTPKHKSDIIRGLTLGAEFNFGQLAQAENVPACLLGLLDMEGQPRAFELRFMEQLLDIAGAAGHSDWTCAKKLTEAIYQAYRDVYDVATAIISGDLDLRDGYDLILIRRGDLLRQTGFRALDVRKPEDRALLRLLCMGSVADQEMAELYDDVWASCDESTKDSLVHMLNLDGSVLEPAVQPTYMPAMLTRGVGTVESRTTDRRKRTLNSLLRYLARVLTVIEKLDKPIIVIERNVLGTLKDVMGTQDFEENPEILESVPVPKDEVAKMA